MVTVCWYSYLFVVARNFGMFINCGTKFAPDKYSYNRVLLLKAMNDKINRPFQVRTAVESIETDKYCLPEPNGYLSVPIAGLHFFYWAQFAVIKLQLTVFFLE